MQPREKEQRSTGNVIRQVVSVTLALALVVGIWGFGAYMLIGAAQDALQGIDTGYEGPRASQAAGADATDEDATAEEEAPPAEGPTPPPPPSPPAPPPAPVSNDRTSCEDIRGTPYRSAQERTFFLANCQGATTVQPAPQTPPGVNRTDCNEIRGTPYRSAQERDFFQANCLGG